MLTYAYLFLNNLVFSCLIEAGAVWLLVRTVKKRNDTGTAFLAIIGTALTIPYVWFVFPTLLYFSPLAIIVVGETFAFLIEGFLYAYLGKFTFRFAFLLSFIANAVSYLLGLLLW